VQILPRIASTSRLRKCRHCRHFRSPAGSTRLRSRSLQTRPTEGSCDHGVRCSASRWDVGGVLTGMRPSGGQRLSAG